MYYLGGFCNVSEICQLQKNSSLTFQKAHSQIFPVSLIKEINISFTVKFTFETILKLIFRIILTYLKS